MHFVPLISLLQAAGAEAETAPLVDLGTAARWLWFVGLFGVVGACGIRLVARRALPYEAAAVEGIERAARRLGLVALLLAAVGEAMRLYEQARAFLDPGEPLTRAALAPVLASGWGEGWVAQVAALAVVLVGLLLARLAARAGWGITMVGALALAATAPLTGHAVGGPWPASVTVPLQGLHVLAGSLWLGTLLGLVVTGFGAAAGFGPAQRAATVAACVRAFSPLALAGAGLAVLAGLVLGWSYIGSVHGLFTSRYGRVLLVKIALLALVMLLGAWNWRRVTPRLGDPAGSALLRRSAALELLVGALLLAVTAALVVLPAPMV